MLDLNLLTHSSLAHFPMDAEVSVPFQFGLDGGLRDPQMLDFTRNTPPHRSYIEYRAFALL